MKLLGNLSEKIPTKAKRVLALALVFVLVLTEFMFDWAEIAVGKIAAVTNPIRGETGRLWQEEKKDRGGSEQVKQLEQSMTTTADISSAQPRSMADLFEILRSSSEINLTRENFLAFYRRLSIDEAREMVEPLNLNKMMRTENWTRTRIVGGQNSLSVYFLDESGQLIMDSYPSRQVLDIAESIERPGQRLEDYGAFTGNIVSAETFYAAFDELTNILQLQIINNPYDLIRWGNDLERVGISRYSEYAVVEIGFEVNVGGQTRVYTYQASEIAAGYLIQAMNRIQPGKKLTMPGARNEEN